MSAQTHYMRSCWGGSMICLRAPPTSWSRHCSVPSTCSWGISLLSSNNNSIRFEQKPNDDGTVFYSKWPSNRSTGLFRPMPYVSDPLVELIRLQPCFTLHHVSPAHRYALLDTRVEHECHVNPTHCYALLDTAYRCKTWSSTTYSSLLKLCAHVPWSYLTFPKPLTCTFVTDYHLTTSTKKIPTTDIVSDKLRVRPSDSHIQADQNILVQPYAPDFYRAKVLNSFMCA